MMGFIPVEQIECPAEGCDVKYDEYDYDSQRKHLDEKHPEIVQERLKRFHMLDGWEDD